MQWLRNIYAMVAKKNIYTQWSQRRTYIRNGCKEEHIFQLFTRNLQIQESEQNYEPHS